MTKEREALKLALEALDKHDYEMADHILWKALAQPEQEPVAVVTGTYGGRFTVKPVNPAMVLPLNMALYTTPPQRKPLTDEEIDKLPWGPHEGNPMTFAEGLRDFARAIEAAHGIKE